MPGLLLAAPAGASFHLMKVVGVFPGAAVQPNAQYVVLQMYSSGQNLVNTHTLTVYDAAGTSVMSFTFAANVANSANQDHILIATVEAASFFGIAADLTMTAVLPRAGGKVCWESFDCVAWGSYHGPATPSAVGTPFDAAHGLTLGSAIRRDLTISGGATTLESTDDTNDSAADFDAALPAPRNNANATGTIPPSTCGNNTLEGLEGCDDGNTTPGDGCDATCHPEGATTSTTLVATGSTTTTTATGCAAGGFDGLLCVLDGLPPDACTGQMLPGAVTRRSDQARGLVTRARDAGTSRARGRLLGKAIKALRKAGNVAARPRTVTKVGATCAQQVGGTLTDARTRAGVLRSGA